MQELLQQVLSAARGMWRFRWAGLAATWVLAVVGTVVVWKIPNQYEASARVYVDTDSILKPLMSGLAVQPNVDQQVTMLSRTLISRPNLEKLVRMADLDLRDQGKAEQDQLIDRLQKGIEIRTAGGANLYAMAYHDRDPDKAKRVIQSMVSIFVESGLGATRKDTDAAKTFLNEQIKIFETKLEESEARLKEFRLRNIDRQGAGDGKDVATRIGEATVQLEAARLQLREAERAREAAKRQLAESRGQGAGSTQLPNLLKDSGIAVATPELDSRIEAQKRNLDQLLQRYTEQHPDVQSTRRLLADLEEQRRREVADLQKKAAAATPSGRGANESLAQQELNRMVAAAEVQVATSQARVEEFSGRVAQLREQLKTAPQIEAEAAQLNRDYAITKKNYEDLVARRQSAVMSGELDVASGVAEFRLIDPPRVDPKPVSPNRLLLYPAALLAAVAAGLLVSFLATQIRPTVADAGELRGLTGLPLLGVVTYLSSDGDRRRNRRGTLWFAGATGSLALLMIGGFVVMFITAGPRV